LYILFALTTGKQVYYLEAAYVCLLAAGAVAVDGWLHARPGRLHDLMLATAVTTAVFVPLALPVRPPAYTSWNPDTRETAGAGGIPPAVTDGGSGAGRRRARSA
jgi:hypothetical protein